MLSFALGLALLCAPQDDAPRLRATLPNGATVLVERMPKAKTISVQLFLSFRGFPETPETHGRRHLLEHLILKGRDGTLARRLETKGMFLDADTFRDAMRIQIDGPSSELATALGAVSEILQGARFDAATLVKETGVLAQEIALSDDARRLSIASWLKGFGDQGLDPLGSAEGLAKADPPALEDLQKRLLSGSRIFLVAAGPIHLESALKQASDAVRGVAKGDPLGVVHRAAAKPGNVQVDACHGEARAAPVGGYSDPQTAWALAAALAVASENQPAFVTYTPSLEPGLILVGRSGDVGLGSKIDTIRPGEEALFFSVGKRLARRWVERYLSEPFGTAFLRGYLLAQASFARPEDLLENIDSMTLAEFQRGYALFREGNAVCASGRGR